jgi:hypothetical protein
MSLLPQALKPANLMPIMHRKVVRHTIALCAAIVCVPTFTSRISAQEQSGKKTFGQQLVDEVASKHRPQLMYLGLHGVTPQSQKSVIFASTDLGKIGKESSCGDLSVVDGGVPIMEMKGKSTTVLERLLDSSGHAVGLLVMGFALADGQESQAAKLAKEIGEELARKIPSKTKLFETGQ